MSNAEVMDIMRVAVMVAIELSAPVLILSMLVGVIISILQAATQIHEQTITFVPKLLVIAVVCLLTGSWMLTTLQDFTKEIFVLMQG